MEAAIIIFWVCLLILFFCYTGYGIILLFLNKIKKVVRPGPATVPQTEWPSVTMIIAAYNEGMVLFEKLENTLAIDYPAGKLKIMVVTDGSTDGSEQIIRSHGEVLVLHS